MTGFARVTGTCGDAAWTWELKSVNGRGLDLRLRLPAGLDIIEGTAREALGRRLSRGNVQAGLSVDRPPRPVEVRVNQPVLDALVAAADEVRRRTGAAPPTVDGLFALRGVIDTVEAAETEAERQALQASALDGLARAADALAKSRATEGTRLQAIVAGHLDAIDGLVARAESAAGKRPDVLKARLMEAVRQLLDADARLDPDRLHQEVVLAATRLDVREELDRLAAHLDHARRLLRDGGPVGRKLDFLAQEFNREANTLCSKSGDRELTEIGLSLKTTIDQLREQVQNVE